MDLVLLELCGWKLEQAGTAVRLFCPQCDMHVQDTLKNLSAATALPLTTAGRSQRLFIEHDLSLHVFCHAMGLRDQHDTPLWPPSPDLPDAITAMTEFIKFYKSVARVARSSPATAATTLRCVSALMQTLHPEAGDALATVTTVGLPEPEPDIPPQVSKSEAARALMKARKILKDIRPTLHVTWRTEVDAALHAIAKVVK